MYITYTLILISFYMMFNHITISYDPCYEPSRKGEKWTDFEDNGLLYELQNNLPISEIAFKHKRTIGSINARRNQIASKLYDNNTNLNDIINITKLNKDQINLILKNKEHQLIKKEMKNNTSDKSKIENKEQHIQNMKDELFMMKYGYWVKKTDKLEELDREYELKKFKQIEKTHPKFFKYESKSQYPKIILQKFDDLPKFENVNYNTQNFLGELTIIDMNNKNTIRYEHSRLEEYRKRGPYGVIQQIDEEKNIVSDIKIKSLESMIYLFENM